MVSGRVFVATLLLITGTTHGELGIRSARVVSESPLHIKPCQPVYFVLEVRANWAEDQLPVEAPIELSREVKINGKVFVLSFNANPVALFELDPASVQRLGMAEIQFRVVGFAFLDAEDRDYLFKTPGRYDLQFSGGARLEVVVDDPTPVERQFLDEIHRSKEEYLAIIMNPSASQVRTILPQLQAWLERYGQTGYTELISIPLGEAKLGDLRNEYVERKSSDLSSLSRRSVALMREHFGPFLKGSPKSPAVGRAGLSLANGLLDQIKNDRSLAPDEAEAIRTEARELLTRVIASPLASRDARRAQERLANLDRSGDP